MQDESDSLRDAIAVRLWECLPTLLEELPEEAVCGGVSERLVLDLARQLSDAVTKPPVEPIAARASDSAYPLRAAQGWAAALDPAIDRDVRSR